MTSRQHEWLRGHFRGELEEGYDRSGESDATYDKLAKIEKQHWPRHTDKDTKVSGDEMQSRHMVKSTHDAADGCQDSCETDDRVQRSHCLRKIRGRDTFSDEEP